MTISNSLGLTLTKCQIKYRRLLHKLNRGKAEGEDGNIIAPIATTISQTHPNN